MLRISATLVDSYNYWLTNDYAKEESLIDSIKGIYRPGWQAEHGTALHAILEEPDPYNYASDISGKGIDNYLCNGVLFEGDDIRECLKHVSSEGEPEVKVSGLYDAGETVKVVTKADRIVNAKIVEYKTKWSAFAIDAYLNAYQWRFYLENFESSECAYKVFCFDKRSSGAIQLKSIETFSCYRYPSMRKDCEEMLRKLVYYVNRKGLRSYLERE